MVIVHISLQYYKIKMLLFQQRLLCLRTTVNSDRFDSGLWEPEDIDQNEGDVFLFS